MKLLGIRTQSGKPRETQGNPGNPRVPHSLHNQLRIILMDITLMDYYHYALG